MLENRRRRLFSAGILLLLLAFVVGMVMPVLPNMRQGLSAHLVGLLGGLLLIALGSLWSELHLPRRCETVAYWLAMFGFYENFVVNVLAAVLATNRLTPLAGPGHLAAPWRENLVTFGFLLGSVVMVSCCLLVLWGLKRRVTE